MFPYDHRRIAVRLSKELERTNRTSQNPDLDYPRNYRNVKVSHASKLTRWFARSFVRLMELFRILPLHMPLKKLHIVSFSV